MLVMPGKQYAADDKYTTAFRATWTGEIPAADPDVDDSNLLGNVEIPVHTAMLSAPVSRNLIEDAAFPIQCWLESELNQVIDLLYEDMILNGTGIGQPTGILQQPRRHRPARRRPLGHRRRADLRRVRQRPDRAGPAVRGRHDALGDEQEIGLRAVMKLRTARTGRSSPGRHRPTAWPSAASG